MGRHKAGLQPQGDVYMCPHVPVAHRWTLQDPSIYLPQLIFTFKKEKIIYLFIFGCFGSLLLRMGFLQLQRAGATLCCGARASHCGGFSCCGAQALGAWASVVVACRLSSCGTQA